MSFKIVAGVFFVVGLGMLSGGVALWRSNAAFAARAVKADGVVTDFKFSQSRGSRSGGGTYAPVVTFKTGDGRKVNLISPFGSSKPGYNLGDHVGVLFDPADPEQAHIDSFMSKWFGVLMLGGMGLVSGAVGGGLLVLQRQIRGWLKLNGERK